MEVDLLFTIVVWFANWVDFKRAPGYKWEDDSLRLFVIALPAPGIGSWYLGHPTTDMITAIEGVSCQSGCQMLGDPCICPS